MRSGCLFSFFFQAEDGIRDGHVTGVQTCALPICNSSTGGFLAQTLLAFTAIVCLPRQFHVAVVECGDVSDIRRARWWFGSYLVIISLMVLPIAVVGQAVFAGQADTVAPDTYVLALPLSQGQIALALAAYIGGFSAATGMVIVTSVALSTMVSNDLVMPWFLRRGWVHQQGSVSATVLWVRRIAILLVAAVAYGYYYGSRSDTVLAAYGLMAFVAVAQFAPGLIGALYWQGASRQGRSEEHTSELQSRGHLVCRLLLE